MLLLSCALSRRLACLPACLILHWYCLPLVVGSCSHPGTARACLHAQVRAHIDSGAYVGNNSSSNSRNNNTHIDNINNSGDGTSCGMEAFLADLALPFNIAVRYYSTTRDWANRYGLPGWCGRLLAYARPLASRMDHLLAQWRNTSGLSLDARFTALLRSSSSSSSSSSNSSNSSNSSTRISTNFVRLVVGLEAVAAAVVVAVMEEAAASLC